MCFLSWDIKVSFVFPSFYYNKSLTSFIIGDTVDGTVGKTVVTLQHPLTFFQGDFHILLILYSLHPCPIVLSFVLGNKRLFFARDCFCTTSFVSFGKLYDTHYCLATSTYRLDLLGDSLVTLCEGTWLKSKVETIPIHIPFS